MKQKLSILLIISSHLTYSQIDTIKLNKIYENKSETEFQNLIIGWQLTKVSDSFSNDTIKAIYTLYAQYCQFDNKYFILQKDFPKTTVNDNEVSITAIFNPSEYIHSGKPLLYIENNIKSLNFFIGDRHFPSQEKMIEYFQRLGFVEKFIILPHSGWGGLCPDLTPIRFEYISFTNNFTLAQVSYSCCSNGGTDIYKYENGKWIKIETINRWLE